IVAGEAIKTGLGVSRYGEQAEQPPGSPAEGARPVTPAGQEAPAILRAVPTLVTAHKPAPRGSSLGFPIGVVTKLPFPRGCYTVQRRRNPRRACISGLYQAFGPEGPVTAMACYRRMVQLGHFLLLRDLWPDAGDFLPPMLGWFPAVAVLGDELCLFQRPLGAHHPHVIRIARFHEPTQLLRAFARR